MCNMLNEIFFKNMKGKEGWYQLAWHLSDTKWHLQHCFLVHFQNKNLSHFSWTGLNGKISPSETAVLKPLCDRNWNMLHENSNQTCSCEDFITHWLSNFAFNLGFFHGGGEGIEPVFEETQRAVKLKISWEEWDYCLYS